MIRNCEVLGITKLAEHTKLAKMRNINRFLLIIDFIFFSFDCDDKSNPKIHVAIRFVQYQSGVSRVYLDRANCVALMDPFRCLKTSAL